MIFEYNFFVEQYLKEGFRDLESHSVAVHNRMGDQFTEHVEVLLLKLHGMHVRMNKDGFRCRQAGSEKFIFRIFKKLPQYIEKLFRQAPRVITEFIQETHMDLLFEVFLVIMNI